MVEIIAELRTPSMWAVVVRFGDSYRVYANRRVGGDREEYAMDYDNENDAMEAFKKIYKLEVC